MSFISSTASNPTLRKLYRSAKTIAKNAKVGEKIMCPCGCLQEFHKENENQIFSTSNGTKCKDRYYNRTRSKSNWPFTQGMLKIERVMSRYVLKNKKPKQTNSQPTLSKPDLKTKVNKEATSENYIALLKQAQSLSKSAKVGEAVMCPCGCNDIFVKTTHHHTYSRKNKEECKDRYHTVIRTEIPFELDVEKILKFKELHNYVNIEVAKQNALKYSKNNNNKIKR